MREPIFFISTADGCKVDRENGIIRGVSVITGGIKAKGHDLWTDDVTLLQMKTHGEQQGTVLVKENHKKGGDTTGIDAAVGYLTNFSVVDNRTRADWHLYPSHPRKDVYLDMAELTPNKFGLSAAFIPPEKPEVKDGKKRARVEELLSVDLVTTPAANPEGLFEARVDTRPGAMPSEANPANSNGNTSPAEPTIADVMKAIGEINQRFDAIDQRFAGIEEAVYPEPTLEQLQELAEMTDEEIAERGLTRQEIEAAIDQAVEAAAAAGEQQIDATKGAPAAAGAAPAAAATAAPAAAALAAMQKEITRLSRRFAEQDRAVELAEQKEAEAAFEALKKQVTELEAVNAAQKKLLEAKGTKPLSPATVEFSAGGQPDANTYEGAVELAVRAGKKRNIALLEVQRARPDLHAAWLAKKGAITL